jgi:putative MATE family efflux protein
LTTPLGAPAPALSVAAEGRPRRDLTQGSLGRWLAALSLPAAAESLLFNATGLSNALWLGQVSGTALSAAVLGTSLRIVLISPMMGLSTGGMAVVANHVGAREQDLANRAVMQTLLLVLAAVLPLAALGLLMGRTFLGWMGASGEVLEEAVQFVTVIFWGLVFMEVLPTMNAVIKGAGHPQATLRISIVHILIWLTLEPLLVRGVGPLPAMGVRGSAWAAVLASAAGVAAQMVTLLRGTAGVRLQWRHLRPDWGMLRRILRIAAPTMAQRFSPNMAEALMLRLVSAFGDQVLSGYSLATRLIGFMRGVYMGISTASTTLVGQNQGAGRPERSERAALLGAVSAAGLSAGLLAVMATYAVPLLTLLEERPDIIAGAAGILYYMIAVIAGQGWLLVMTGALSAAGDAVAAMWINVLAVWGLQLPLAWALSQGLGLGPAGLWVGMGIAAVLAAVVVTWRFRGGQWKARAV